MEWWEIVLTWGPLVIEGGRKLYWYLFKREGKIPEDQEKQLIELVEEGRLSERDELLAQRIAEIIRSKKVPEKEAVEKSTELSSEIARYIGTSGAVVTDATEIAFAGEEAMASGSTIVSSEENPDDPDGILI